MTGVRRTVEQRQHVRCEPLVIVERREQPVLAVREDRGYAASFGRDDRKAARVCLDDRRRHVVDDWALNEDVCGCIGHLQHEEQREGLMHAVEVGLLGYLRCSRLDELIPVRDPAMPAREAVLGIEIIEDIDCGRFERMTAEDEACRWPGLIDPLA